MIDQLTKEEKLIIVRACQNDLIKWGHRFHPNLLTRPSSPLHQQMATMLDSSDRKVVILVPRSIGKTTWGTVIYPCREICMRRAKYIVIVSCTSTVAVERTDSLKSELATNEIINEFFGSMKGIKDSEGLWITSNNIVVRPRGAGQQIRGLLCNGIRPDRIILDDSEDPETVQSVDQRRKFWEWLFGDVNNAFDNYAVDPDQKLIVLGTILHEDSALNRLWKDPPHGWKVINLKLCNDNFESTCPDYASNKFIQDKVLEARDTKTMSVFYREFMNEVRGDDDLWDKMMFKYYNVGENAIPEIQLNYQKYHSSVVFVDSAMTNKDSSDFSGIVGVTFNLLNGNIYVREAIQGRWNPDDTIVQACSMAARIRANVISLKTTGGRNYISYPFTHYIVHNRLPITIHEVVEHGKKNDRIKQMFPLFAQGFVYFNKQTCGDLEVQLISFPRSSNDDLIDPLADIVDFFDKTERYFPQETASAWEKDEEDLMFDYSPEEKIPFLRAGVI